jgi:lipopolysaccharide assembly outer membrane protein LptD (OstA)
VTKNNRIIQLFLIGFGMLLIISTYFLYPALNQKKTNKNETNKIEIAKDGEANIAKDNAFENVEYKGFYNITNPFLVKAKKANILNEEPDVVFMENMKVTIDMKDGRTVVIESDRGSYNKASYDCFFEENVRATDGKTTLLSENLDLMASSDSALIYNKVFLDSENGSLKADKIDYNFKTKYYKVSMFNNERIKLKLIK